MPVIKIHEISSERAIAIWNITESLEELLDQRPLSAYDKTLYDRFTHHNKKREWLAGRLTLKALSEHHLIPFKGIVRNDDGKPTLIDSKAEISLSHSFPYVAGIIDYHEDVGIDLEQPKEKLNRISQRFLSQPELDFVKGDLNKLCICWCAKETLYKIYSKRALAFKENMKIEPFELNKEQSFKGSIILNGNTKSYTMKYVIAQDYILTFNI